MSEDEFYEEASDIVVELFRDYINTENQLITKEHELEEKLYSWDYIIVHLNEIIPKTQDNLHELNVLVSDKLLDIREYIESNEINGLKIVKEHKKNLSKLEKNVEHRKWALLKEGLDYDNSKLKKFVKVKKHELKELHSKIIGLMKIMKKSKLIKAINEDLTIKKEKENFIKKEEYYFIQIYKYLRAYERIFRHLWRKEKILAKKIKKTSKKIKD